MVSITGVSAGQAGKYYTQKDNYYSKESGTWQGKGAEALGLSGEIDKESFTNLLHGRDKDANQLISDGVGNQGHRAGTDLTFSAPKSVSILSEVLGDERVREAHDKAVEKALNHIEGNYAQARQTVDGRTERVNTGNLVIAKFDHDTSRELDPQLHSHCVVMNMTQRDDGNWRAVSNEALFDNKMLLGQVYRNELAANLKELGYSIQSDNKGLFEVSGVDKGLLDHYSQRKEQIATKVSELKELYPDSGDQKLREMAALGSRVAKKDVDGFVLREEWQTRLQEQGYTKDSVLDGISKASEQAKAAELNTHRMSEYDYIRQATDALTRQESVFSKEDVLKAAGKLSIGEQRIDNLEKAFDELVKDKEILNLEKNTWTTKDMLSTEASIVRKVEDGHGKVEPIMGKEQAETALKSWEEKNFKMTDGQREATMHILTSTDRVIGIQGDSGAGKTTSLKAVREIIEEQNSQRLQHNTGKDQPQTQFFLQGLGFTGKSAKEIETNAKISSQTLHSYLPKESENRDKSHVLIVDEASMTGSRQAYDLISRAERENARVIMIGDVRQLQAIEAGGIFQKLQESGVMKTAYMTESIRQKTDHMKDIVTAIKGQNIDKSFDRLKAENKIHEVSDRTDRINALVKDYTSRTDYKDTLVVTALNADRTEINNNIRGTLKEQGKLVGEEHNLTVRESKGINEVEKHFAQSYKQGDIVTVNGTIKGFAKGQEGHITDTDQQNHTITLSFKEKTSGADKLATIDLKKDGDKISAYQEKQAGFIQGDKIVFLKNDKKLNVQNGLTADIKSIDKEGNIKAVIDKGREVAFNVRNYSYMDHGYAVTDYKSQGQTAKDVIYHAPTDVAMAEAKNTYNSFYVAVTRGKEDTKVFTDNTDKLQEQVKNVQSKATTLDYNVKLSDKEIDAFNKGKELLASSDKLTAQIEGHMTGKATTESGIKLSLFGKAAKTWDVSHNTGTGNTTLKSRGLSFHFKDLPLGYSSSKERVIAGSDKGQVKETKMWRLGSRAHGTTKTTNKNGLQLETKWSGKMTWGLMGGKLKIEKTETRVLGQKEPGMLDKAIGAAFKAISDKVSDIGKDKSTDGGRDPIGKGVEKDFKAIDKDNKVKELKEQGFSEKDAKQMAEKGDGGGKSKGKEMER